MLGIRWGGRTSGRRQSLEVRRIGALDRRKEAQKASILSSCFLLTHAQGRTGFFIKVEPEMLTEGQSVTLTPVGVDQNIFISCIWFRGTTDLRNKIFTYYRSPFPGQLNGPVFTDREAGGPDFSLRITDLRTNDSGTYILRVEGPLGSATKDTTLVVSGSAPLSAGVISRIVIGSLVALTLIGTLLCVFLCAWRLRNKTSTQDTSAPPFCENTPPSGQVKAESSSDPIYEVSGDRSCFILLSSEKII
ncbi:uncharacterized protein LOC133370205 isoform X2 [Rhineura floridana]|uniref:uncharacterized protein LOC133370205 isoform X2 n=1 Tax=Rhineura floridana TaxID=261503 RepID=UPI002AC87710|nr:uncharacterized protein LOC133370205 isoform X2 [Rhineura floridana]